MEGLRSVLTFEQGSQLDAGIASLQERLGSGRAPCNAGESKERPTTGTSGVGGALVKEVSATAASAEGSDSDDDDVDAVAAPADRDRDRDLARLRDDLAAMLDARKVLHSAAATVRRAAAFAAYSASVGVCQQMRSSVIRVDGLGEHRIPPYLTVILKVMQQCAESDTDPAVRQHAANTSACIRDVLEHVLRASASSGFIGIRGLGSAAAGGSSTVRIISVT